MFVYFVVLHYIHVCYFVIMLVFHGILNLVCLCAPPSLIVILTIKYLENQTPFDMFSTLLSV